MGFERLPLGATQHYDDAELYEHEYRRRRDDVAHYVDVASRHLAPEERVLDVCCGSGRISRALLREGFAVTGVDQSAPMLQRAETSIGRLPRVCRPRATFLTGDMRTLALGERFRLVICAFNSFEHLYTRPDAEKFLERVHEHLTPDGLFALDAEMPNLPWLMRSPDKRWGRTQFRHPRTGQKLEYTTNHDWDAVAQIVHIRLYYAPVEQGPLKETAIVHLSQRKFFPEELRSLLHYNGFEILRHEADFDGVPLDEYGDSQTLVCRAKTGK